MDPDRPRRKSKDRFGQAADARGLGVEERSLEERWNRRRAAAIAVRAGIVGGPIAGSVAAMAVLSRVLPSPAPHAGVAVRIGWWTAILAGSLGAMWLIDRATRRLAPLAALLDMAVLFPGRAPTRLKVARQAGDLRQLQAFTAQATSVGRREGLAEAAEHILALVGSLRAHDRHTRGHSERVRVYTDLIAAEMRLPPAAVDRLRWAALLHDIGKLRVPTAVLNKPAKLSSPEWETVRLHPLAGADLASALLPWLGGWGKAIAEHHERFDGTGYPMGLAGRDISLAGRIVGVADSFEVMTASRAYKKAMTRGTALEEVVRCSGTQFDPEVVRALLAVSAPRLRWAMGPTSWLVGTPLLGSAPSLTAAGVAAQAAVGVSAVAIAGVTGVAGPATAAASYAPNPTASASPVATSSNGPATSRAQASAHVSEVRAGVHQSPVPITPSASQPSTTATPTQSQPRTAVPPAGKATATTATTATAPTKAATPSPKPLAKTTPPPKAAPVKTTPPPKATPTPTSAPSQNTGPANPPPAPTPTKTKKGNNGNGNNGNNGNGQGNGG